ncbi:hypothetical protein Nepgr_004674 [Nepenthes gracilis]|uniref:Disease resistance N-terminal domain-containing protein n=1 Tax=Nepenthes gracilis TaxID=150966 RepID=A0AAD3XFJ6_NEPGR|nr:hypothetical protein Nepgr_004674 [Nepenthes gracilis]
MDAVVTAATNWIGSQIIDEASLLIGVEDQIRNLQDELKCMQRYIQDAEDRQGEDGGDGQVAIFATKIREIAFHAEDVIDIYILKVQSRTIENIWKSRSSVEFPGSNEASRKHP